MRAPSCRTGCHASSATSSCVRRSSARRGARRSCTPCCTCSATTTATRWRHARRCTGEKPPIRLRVVQLRLRGHHPRAPHPAEHADPLRDRVRGAPVDLTLIALLVTVILVIATKAISGRGTPLKGGLPSGHAALAFAGWMALTYLVADSTHRFLVSSITLLMALLVAQTRVESGVHSLLDVTYGGLLGSVVTLVLFHAF